MREGHISRAFDGELAALHIHVLELGGLVLHQVHEATHAYAEWSERRGQAVCAREGQVTAAASAIFEQQLQLIARRNPVASDLRSILGLARIASELERAGAEGRKIARAVLQQAGRPARSTAGDVHHLAHLAGDMLRRALDALDVLDAVMAENVIDQDRDLDLEYAAGLRRLLTRAMENPAQTEVTVEAAFTLKSLERIGDHARNIAGQVRAITGDHAQQRQQPAPQPQP